jgi:7-keto-8-aminopelargonate synthetase-like enzyme
MSQSACGRAHVRSRPNHRYSFQRSAFCHRQNEKSARHGSDVVNILGCDYPGLAFNPAASMPAMAQASSLSEVSPLIPTAPSRTLPS